ncbi:MAG: low molecular weight protein-tyrosine-phosphatase [Pseudomonadota bacterium]
MPRILMVCLGNICRSPTAEVVLKTLRPDWEIDSAGTGDWYIGKPPHADARAAGAARGYDLSALRARRVRTQDFQDFDLILAMDHQNLRDLQEIRPDHARAELALLLDFAKNPGTGDVPDPYYTGTFEEVLDLIEDACHGLVDRPPPSIA